MKKEASGFVTSRFIYHLYAVEIGTCGVGDIISLANSMEAIRPSSDDRYLPPPYDTSVLSRSHPDVETAAGFLDCETYVLILIMEG